MEKKEWKNQRIAGGTQYSCLNPIPSHIKSE